jgi:hypothetical protein
VQADRFCLEKLSSSYICFIVWMAWCGKEHASRLLIARRMG